MQAEKDKLIMEVRERLKARGAKTIRGMGRVFKIFDDSGDRKIDRQEFYYGLKDMGLEITKKEAETLMDYLDKDGDGYVNYDEFLIGMRGQLNQRRQAIVDKCFLQFDKDGSGFITSNDLKGVYNTNLHPKVKSGEMTEDEVFMEFLQNFGDKNKDGTIDRKEWNDYYSAVSASIDNDDHFIQLMKKAWHLD